ncbi:MAG: hypothetical protein ACHQNT_03995 [Bacteroidia bacterium]
MNVLMKIIFAMPFLFFSSLSFSQSPVSKPEPKFEEPKFEEHQFYLTEPAIKIMEIQYDKDCTPVKGKLSDDGKTIFIKDYSEHSRVYLKFLKADGKVEEITKSPCFIDPVVPVL